MRRKIIAGLVSCVLVFSLTGCGETTTTLNVNVENSEDLNSTELGAQALTEIGNDLWFDSATGIVYMAHGTNSAYESKTFCPYYAPNGLPYKYDPDSKTFEEIKSDEESDDESNDESNNKS